MVEKDSSKLKFTYGVSFHVEFSRTDDSIAIVMNARNIVDHRYIPVVDNVRVPIRIFSTKDIPDLPSAISVKILFSAFPSDSEKEN